MFNFPFVDDSPEYKKDANDFLAEIKTGKYDVYTSEYVAQERRDGYKCSRSLPNTVSKF
jgi:hypothetical protein